VLVIGNFDLSHGGGDWWVHFGGWCGIVTAAVAWYASAAGVLNGVAGRVMLPVGRPLVPPAESPIPVPVH
jgi:succinate-acetate transporter protein